ncbi:MAG: CBS domain-containing protein [Proteobacteria bacterium]|nr:CBS domain-containing protein [Pseudomonadota bacterium]
MNSPELHVLPSSEGTTGSITELFHRINRVLPDSQRVLTIPGETLAVKALAIMKQHGYSQLPVVVGTEVLGVFSYRLFSETVLAISASERNSKVDLGDLTVEECLEKAEFARVTDEFQSWFDALDRQDVVLVGEAFRLQGIVTPMDVLRYLYRVASPFVLIAEIELALRALIRLAVSEDKLAECAKTSLSKCYVPERLPTNLEDMTFHDYVQIIGDGRYWQFFEAIFRGTRERTRVKLEIINDLRNTVFHLREIKVEDYENLVMQREWMLTRAMAAEARAKGGVV